MIKALHRIKIGSSEDEIFEAGDILKLDEETETHLVKSNAAVYVEIPKPKKIKKVEKNKKIDEEVIENGEDVTESDEKITETDVEVTTEAINFDQDEYVKDTKKKK